MKAIGIDIGGTQIKAGLLVGGSRFGSERIWPTPIAESPDLLSRQLRDLCAEYGEFDRLGIACAGIIDRSRGRICFSPNLPGWHDLALADLVERELGHRPAVLNDANAFVLAEARLGAADVGASSVVGITLGTGVGGGVLLDGRLWEGRNGFAGEIGHMTIDLDGPDCACGHQGCLESRIGTQAILDCYAKHGGTQGSNVAILDPKGIAARAESGEDAARETYSEVGRILGISLAGLTHLLDPALFIIGGGVSLAGDLLLKPARAALIAAVMLEPDRVPEVRAATLGNSAGWIGAALAAATDRSDPEAPR